MKKQICRTFANFSFQPSLLFVFFLLFFAFSGVAQQTDSSGSFVSRMQQRGIEETKNSILQLTNDKISIKQNELLEKILKTARNAKFYLKNGIDTFGMQADLEKVNRWFQVASDDVLTNKGNTQTYRNLAITYKIVFELLNIIQARKNELDRHQHELIKFRFNIDSLSSDSALYTFPTDSVKLNDYLERVRVTAKELSPVDSSLLVSSANVSTLQTKINQVVLLLTSSLEEIQNHKKNLSNKIFERELGDLGTTIEDARPIQEIYAFSAQKGKLSFLFYCKDHSGKILFLLALLIAITFFLKSLKQILKDEQLLRADFSGQLVLRFPFLSALLIVLSLYQFVFPDPPFIFSCLIWVITSVTLPFIFRGFITKQWMGIYLILLLLFLLACSDNLILQASTTERWMMLVLAAVGVVSASLILVGANKTQLKEKLILYFIGLTVLLETASIISNIYGRYNLSKALLASGYFNVIIGILLLWVVRLINEALSLASKVYTKNERKLFYINFEKIGEKVSPLFYVILVIGWLILIGRNFYIYEKISDPIKDFVFEERTVGDYTFSISKLLLFFLIIILSLVVSKIVSFFASDKHAQIAPSPKDRKVGVGSWLLLIRITIISIGIFLAFAAAGIPMDKIAIVLGALGVGIGFGMQTLVNNLVSGLIVAFEKPVNVGDTVEIGGHSGIMKSVGFRSSIISTVEGADVIIPNGDLLNAHMINWTMGKPIKRLEILVSVAYGTDISKVDQLVGELLKADQRILKYPASAVLAKDFNTSAIDLQILFWVHHINEAGAVKSDMIHSIDMTFKEHGIVIPIPQQEIRIHTDNNNETTS